MLTWHTKLTVIRLVGPHKDLLTLRSTGLGSGAVWLSSIYTNALLYVKLAAMNHDLLVRKAH